MEDRRPEQDGQHLLICLHRRRARHEGYCQPDGEEQERCRQMKPAGQRE
jgi:hypothetical protein